MARARNCAGGIDKIIAQGRNGRFSGYLEDAFDEMPEEWNDDRFGCHNHSRIRVNLWNDPNRKRRVDAGVGMGGLVSMEEEDLPVCLHREGDGHWVKERTLRQLIP